MLTSASVSLSPDTIAIRDQLDEKNVHFFDTSSGKQLNDGKPFQHRLEIAEVALDQVGLQNQRKLAFVDKNRDLFLTSLAFRTAKSNSCIGAPGKLGAMVLSLKWNTEANMLTALQDMRLTVYLYPSVIFVDKGLLGRTMIERDAAEFGKRPTLISFVGNHISIRRADGSLITTAVSPYPAVIYNNVTANR